MMKSYPFALADLETLKQWDTPTICNGLELIVPERRGVGFTVEPMAVLHADAAPIIGLARTGTVRSKEPPRGAVANRLDWYDYVANASLPTVVVLQDLDDRPGYGAFWGEVHTNVHLKLGAAGCVTNGSFRDLAASAKDFQIIGGRVGPSHAHIHVVDFGGPVNIFGMQAAHDDVGSEDATPRIGNSIKPPPDPARHQHSAIARSVVVDSTDLANETLFGRCHASAAPSRAGATTTTPDRPHSRLAWLTPGRLCRHLNQRRKAVREADGKSEKLAQAKPLAPIRPGKVLCCGINYASHAEENPNAKMPSVQGQSNHNRQELHRFGLIGPCIVITDEMTQPGAIRLTNGSTARQDGNTSEWLFHLPQLISFLSQVMT